MKIITFDSSIYSGHEAFDAYRDLYSVGTEATRIGGVFSVKVSGLRFPQMLLFDRILRGVSHERNPRRVLIDGFDHIMLQLVLDGRMMSLTGNIARVVERGEIIIFDVSRPQRTWTEHARIATVSVARAVVAKVLPLHGDVHGIVLPASEAGFLADLIRSLIRNGPGMGETMAAVATSTLGATLGATLGSRSVSADDLPFLEIAKLNQVLEFIETNLGRLDLTAEIVAHANGLSRSALYRMFEPIGGVAARVQERRLQALRRALVRPSEMRAFHILAQECGFGSSSHASRSFRSAFGRTPTEFRQEHVPLSVPSDIGADTVQKTDLARWLIEVR